MFSPIPHKKGSSSLYILLLILAAGCMIGVRQCSKPHLPPRAENIATGDTINVAIEISPTGVTMQGDTLGGLYYDLLNEASRRHRRPLKFHPFTLLSTALKGLDEGKYQLVVSDIPATAELKEKYLFINPVGIDKQVLVQRRDTTGAIPVKTQFDLGGRHITVPRNSPYISRLRNLSHEIGDTIYITEDPEYSSEQLIILTSLGEIPNVVVSARTAAPLLAKYPNLDASLLISFNQFQGWVLAPRDSTLRDTLNTWFAE